MELGTELNEGHYTGQLKKKITSLAQYFAKLWTFRDVRTITTFIENAQFYCIGILRQSKGQQDTKHIQTF